MSAANLADNPERIRWNGRYERRRADAGTELSSPGELADRVFACTAPAGAVLELAGGPSGTALALAEGGRQVTVVDVSDTALATLARHAEQRGVARSLTLVHADLTAWTPPGDTTGYAVVLCRFFWDRSVFQRACGWVAPGGLIGWEAPALVDGRPGHGRAEWCLAPGEPECLLLPDFTVALTEDLDHDGTPIRRLVARRQGGQQ